MYLNPVKKVKIANFPSLESLINVDELNPGKKMIVKLNHDCLAKVLMYTSILDRLEMENVCQKWREASELSWYGVKKLNSNDLMIRLVEREEILKKIIWRCGRYLTHLTVNNEDYSWIADILRNNCNKIIHFDIDDGNGPLLEGRQLVEVIESMRQLKYLKVSIFELNMNEDDNLNELFQVLPEDIEEIHVVNRYRSGFGFIPGVSQVLLDKFINLHCLSLQGMSLTDATFESINSSKNTLTHLDLSKCEFQSRRAQIFSNLKNLEQLILLDVFNVNDDVIRSIAHNCSKLKRFQFTRINWRQGDLSYDIFRELRYLNLEYLQFDKVDGNENIISGLGNNWKNLKHLNIDKGNGFSPLDLQEIMKFKKLERLNLFFANVDSELFINITNNFPELKQLSVFYEDISETARVHLTNLKKLEKLNFLNFEDLTENFLLRVVNNCKNLIDIDLRYCKNITEASLIQVGKLEYLKKLDINGIKNVPHEMFYNLRNIEYLSCSYCPNVTDEVTIKVIGNCKKLFFFNVIGTGITVESLVYASNREFVFTKLTMHVNKDVKDAYTENNSAISPYFEVKYLFYNYGQYNIH